MDSCLPQTGEARARKQVRPHPDSPPKSRVDDHSFSKSPNGLNDLPLNSSFHSGSRDKMGYRSRLQLSFKRSSKLGSKRFSMRSLFSSLKRAMTSSQSNSHRDTVMPLPPPAFSPLDFPRDQVKAQLEAQVQRQLVAATVAEDRLPTTPRPSHSADSKNVSVIPICATSRAQVKYAKALPPPCLNQILSYLSPEDICRVAAVNHAWAAAAETDEVWTGKLPPHYKTLVSLPLSPRGLGEEEMEGGEEQSQLGMKEYEEEEESMIEICQSSRQSFIQLAEGMVVTKGQQHVSLDPCSGSFRIAFSVAMSMGVFVPHDPESWTYDVAARGSPFLKIAEVHPYSFYMLGGPINGQLPSGRYSVAWRLSRCQGVEQIQSNQSCASVCASFIDASGPLGPPLNLGWQDGLLESRITGHNFSGKSQQVTRLPVAESSVLQVPMWSEVVVAEIEVKAVIGERLCPFELTVELNEVQGRSWVGRLFVDSVVLRQLE